MISQTRAEVCKVYKIITIYYYVLSVHKAKQGRGQMVTKQLTTIPTKHWQLFTYRHLFHYLLQKRDKHIQVWQWKSTMKTYVVSKEPQEI